MTWYSSMGADKELAGTLVSVSLVALSAILTGIGVYDNIAKFGGAGTLVPITGFANAVVSPALEFKSEGFILGLGAKIFIIAGPVKMCIRDRPLSFRIFLKEGTRMHRCFRIRRQR